MTRLEIATLIDAYRRQFVETEAGTARFDAAIATPQSERTPDENAHIRNVIEQRVRFASLKDRMTSMESRHVLWRQKHLLTD